MSFSTQGYISALSAKTFCHDDGVFDPELHVLLLAVPLTDKSASLFLCVSPFFFDLQMTNPAIQNDFSYYRRTLSRMRINNIPVSATVLALLMRRLDSFCLHHEPHIDTVGC